MPPARQPGQWPRDSKVMILVILKPALSNVWMNIIALCMCSLTGCERRPGWRRMTGIRPGYFVPSAGAGAGERPSSSLSEPEQAREPGHGQCCLNTFGAIGKNVERNKMRAYIIPLLKKKNILWVKTWKFDCRNLQDCVKWRQVAECPFKLEVTFYSCHISICYNMKCLCSLTSAIFWIIS